MIQIAVFMMLVMVMLMRLRHSFIRRHAVCNSSESIKTFDSLNCRITEKHFEVDIEHPHIPIGQHNVYAFVYFFTEVYRSDIDPNIGHFLQKCLLPNKK